MLVTIDWLFKMNLKTTIIVEPRLINMGTIKKEEKKTAVFSVRNTGNNDLIIKTVEPDCHCTIVFWTKEPVKPKGVANITLEYDNSITGIFQRTATVYTNSSEEVLILTIRGKVVN